MKTFDQLPELIQKRMLQAQVEQGNPEDPKFIQSLSVFRKLMQNLYNSSINYPNAK